MRLERIALAHLVVGVAVGVAGCGGAAKHTATASKGRTAHATVNVYFCTVKTCGTVTTAAQVDGVRSTLKSNPLVKSVKFVFWRKNTATLVATATPGSGHTVAASLKPFPPGVQSVRVSER